MSPNLPPIRTPDQRLRVFVSSTLGELAPERAVVRSAIEQLRLTPVLFELGARPHPPRELYRSYLDQSHVFLGIYWQRYGWVAPGEDVSGLEDEYRLAGDRPRLLYLKEPAPDRERRLEQLLADVQADDRAAYRRFTTLDELRSLVVDDLAVLLSERFEATVGGPGPEAPPGGGGDLPRPLTGLVGRDDLIDDVVGRLRAGDRLVALTGPGGIGKTRVALAVAHRLADELPDGAAFVPLADIDDADRALAAVAHRLGAHAEAAAPAAALAAALRGRRVLVVLDNVEQVAGIAGAVADLLERTPGPQVLVTGRRALHVRGEVDVAVDVLGVPAPGAGVAEVEASPAVRLFRERAPGWDPGAPLGAADADALGDVVRRLDGLPLAIELAAARTRLLTPSALAERLGAGLDLLATTAADVPERQRTLRGTLDWSHDLLTEHERSLLAALSAFAGGWTLEAAEAVGGPVVPGADVLEVLAALLDESLVVSGSDPAGAPRFQLLGTVRAYAAERLDARPDAEEVRRRHLAWCAALAERAQPHLCGPGQREWVARMAEERANLAQAVATALALGEHAAVVALTWDVIVGYFVQDAVAEPDAWLQAVAAAGADLDEVTEAELRSLLALTRLHHGDADGAAEAQAAALRTFEAHGMDFEAAVALHQIGFLRFRLDGDAEGALAALERSSSLFASVDHDWGVSLAEAMAGSVHAAVGDLDAAEACQLRALERARRIDSDQQVVQALGQLALVRLLQERWADARDLLAEAAPLVAAAGLRTDAANLLDALAVVAHQHGDDRTAARAQATAAAERQRLGVVPWPTLVPHIDRVHRWVVRALGEAVVDEIAAGAREAEVLAVVDEALAAGGGEA